MYNLDMTNEKNKKILMAVTLFFWYAQYVYVPYQTPYLAGLGISATVIGIILGAYGFSQMVIRIPLGLMSDRVPRHKLMIAIGAACAGIASLLRAVSVTDATFLVANLISGFASATYISFTVLNSTYYSPDEIQKAMGTITAFNNAGILIAFVTGMIVSQFVSVQMLFYLSCLSGLIGFVVSLFIKTEKHPDPKTPFRTLFSTFADKKLIIFALLALLLQMIHMSTAMSFTTQVATDIGGSNVEIGLISVVYMAFAIFGAYFVGRKIAQKIGSRLLMVVCFACFVVYCLLVPAAGSLVPIYFLQAVAGFSNGIIFSLCMSAAVSGVSPDKKSSAMGFFQAVYGIGMTVGPMIVGAVRDVYGMSVSFFILAPFACVGIIIAIIVYGRKFDW